MHRLERHSRQNSILALLVEPFTARCTGLLQVPLVVHFQRHDVPTDRAPGGQRRAWHGIRQALGRTACAHPHTMRVRTSATLRMASSRWQGCTLHEGVIGGLLVDVRAATLGFEVVDCCANVFVLRQVDEHGLLALAQVIHRLALGLHVHGLRGAETRVISGVDAGSWVV